MTCAAMYFRLLRFHRDTQYLKMPDSPGFARAHPFRPYKKPSDPLRMHSSIALSQHESTTVMRFNQAYTYHQAGRLIDAAAAYREILATTVCPEASYYLGLLCMQQSSAPEAANHIDDALAFAPCNAAWLNNRGNVAVALNDHEGAAGFYYRAVAAAPEFALAHFNLGNACRHAGHYDVALECYERALELEPGLVDAALYGGAVLEYLSRLEEAIARYQLAVDIAPNDPRALARLGNALNSARHHEQAQLHLEHAARLDPDNVDVLFGLAYAYDAQRYFEAALNVYRKALTLQPDAAHLHNNLAFTLTCLARYDEADDHFTRALQLKPELSEAHHQLGMSALRRGDFRRGWIGYEHRKTTASGLRNYHPLSFPEWRGEPLAGKRVLLAREQGAGDQLQFIRYAAVLHAFGATVDVWTTSELAALFARAEGVSRVVTEAPAEGYDFWCRMMSVPRYLVDLTIPASTPYLFADHYAALAWHQQLAFVAGAKKKVGLVWAGNPHHHLDALRSIPLASLEPLASVPDIEWFAIQKGDAEQQLVDVTPRWPVHALGPQLHSFDATAAVISALDLVITVDTSVAHLAGALGKPVWVLLAAQSDWRWMLDGSHCMWYPNARLFRQTGLGTWPDVIDSVRNALIAL